MQTEQDAQQLVIRSLTVDDAAAVASLSGQLGYPESPEKIRGRLQAVLQLEEHIALAAARGTVLLGWIDAGVERHLQAEDAVVIGGLVVAEGARGRGVGKILCEQVENWARQLGFSRVRVRSQIKREDAHRFYLREGYRQVKTSLVFEKALD